MYIILVGDRRAVAEHSREKGIVQLSVSKVISVIGCPNTEPISRARGLGRPITHPESFIQVFCNGISKFSNEFLLNSNPVEGFTFPTLFIIF